MRSEIRFESGEALFGTQVFRKPAGKSLFVLIPVPSHHTISVPAMLLFPKPQGLQYNLGSRCILPRLHRLVQPLHLVSRKNDCQ